MQIKKGLILRKIADVHVVVPTGESNIDFNGIITLNDTAAFLFQQLLLETTKAALLAKLLEEYEVDEKKAQVDIDTFCAQLEEANLIA